LLGKYTLDITTLRGEISDDARKKLVSRFKF